MTTAGLGIQTGYLGWIAAMKSKDPEYPKNFPNSGPFKLCRQPIYLSFALITWSSPYFTLDKFCLAFTWSLYCYFGPRLKEARYMRRWRDDFMLYQSKIPYFLPRLFS
jgi:protein-S-isoprenylcysteine O-methyltransferase Ste14